MEYRGHIERGIVVLDEAATLPDGTTVTVRVEQPPVEHPIGSSLEKLAGLAELPADIAEHHDQYRRGRIAG